MLFTAGGIATPADAALMMQLGADGVFVGSGIFKSGNPAAARQGDRQGDHCTSTTPTILAKVSRGLGEAMVGINVEELPATTGSPSAAGDRGRRRSGSWRCRATSASTCARSRRSGADARRGARPPTSSTASTAW